jgi:hypothetical protein
MATETGADVSTVHRGVAELARGFAADRGERQQRDHLDPADLGCPGGGRAPAHGPAGRHGGLWRDVRTSTRPICEIYRALARGDSSLALTTSMHPAVLAYWLATPEVPEPDAAAWRRQHDVVSTTVEEGAWWARSRPSPAAVGTSPARGPRPEPPMGTGSPATPLSRAAGGC